MAAPRTLARAQRAPPLRAASSQDATSTHRAAERRAACLEPLQAAATREPHGVPRPRVHRAPSRVAGRPGCVSTCDGAGALPASDPYGGALRCAHTLTRSEHRSGHARAAPRHAVGPHHTLRALNLAPNVLQASAGGPAPALTASQHVQSPVGVPLQQGRPYGVLSCEGALSLAVSGPLQSRLRPQHRAHAPQRARDGPQEVRGL